MKMKFALNRFARIGLAIAFASVTELSKAADGPIVHEWGTFTSVQGGDGALIPWQATEIGDLPKFVHNWMQPDLNRRCHNMLLYGKGGLTSLQRMETPVIYFYSDKEMAADVTVRFPKGYITEWYPQAAQIGPSSIRSTNATSAYVAKDSLIRWQNVQISPMKSAVRFATKLPSDTNGTHYFAARETDAAFLRANNFSPTNAADEHEKFLFYRGSGNFSTPLTVTVNDGGLFTLTNSGRSPITGVLLLRVGNGFGEWQRLGDLRPGASSIFGKINLAMETGRLPFAEFKKNVSETMVRALTETGLYPAEAKAMVKTWSDAWFAEEGVRVLYVLPRDWTDETLPLTLNPKPRELVRVMVGRAEIVMPRTQQEIVAHLQRSDNGDKKSQKWLEDYAKKFGRFAPPAFQLARQHLARPENKPVANVRATRYIP